MKTEFRKLAERIDRDIYGSYGVCCDLPELESNYFIDYFKPTSIERDAYDHNFGFWLSQFGQSIKENNSFRILILLMAEQHYLTYKK